MTLGGEREALVELVVVAMMMASTGERKQDKVRKEAIKVG